MKFSWLLIFVQFHLQSWKEHLQSSWTNWYQNMLRSSVPPLVSKPCECLCIFSIYLFANQFVCYLFWHKLFDISSFPWQLLTDKYIVKVVPCANATLLDLLMNPPTPFYLILIPNSKPKEFVNAVDFNWVGQSRLCAWLLYCIRWINHNYKIKIFMFTGVG